MPQTKIILQCQECDSLNYVTSKNRQNVSDKLELKKHCPVCNKHTQHQETRIRK